MIEVTMCLCCLVMSAMVFTMYITERKDHKDERKDLINRLEAKNVAEYSRLSNVGTNTEQISVHQRNIDKWHNIRNSDKGGGAD